MKAVVLVAGKGERLKPLTETRPKHLLPIGGKPLLTWILDRLIEVGVDKVLLVTHYLEDQIRGYFGDGSHLGLDINYKIQKEMRGTADAFKVAEDFIEDEEFIGVYGDLFLPPDGLKFLVQNHRKGENTMSVVPVDDPSSMGVVALKGDKVIDIVEKPSPGKEPSNLANAGMYIFTPDIFRYINKTSISKRNEYEITDSLKALIESGGILRSINLPKSSWLDIGLPWNLLDANKSALASLQTSIEGNVEDGVQIHGSVKISKGARIRFGTYIEGPVWIGSGSDIGPNCYLRPSTSIGANVRIGNACEIKNSIILDSTHIAHLSYVGDSIIGERVNLGAGTITANIRFDKKNVKVEIKGKRIDSGKRKFGAIIGDDVQTGINVSLMPGVKIGSSAWISPGLTVNENVESGLFLKTMS
jgi:bifunctional UDP-N-acetylglucosamine pyrophosphorylase/glucosamine-1-phosphate N-acetyltransferase